MRELYHYGVKGMKWGVRRYQNADGTLTSKGKARQAKQTKKAQKKWDKNASRQRHEVGRSTGPKEVF